MYYVSAILPGFVSVEMDEVSWREYNTYDKKLQSSSPAEPPV